MAPNRRLEPPKVSLEVIIALVLALACVGWGLWLRAYALGRPTSFASDEYHFVNGAQRYLQGLPDENDHPALGKLLIALGIRAFGDDGLGWRCVPALFGAASVAFAGLLARRLFSSSAAWVFALVLVSLDGFAIAYSRVALLDSMLTSLLLLSLLLSLGQSTVSLVGAIVVGGLAMGIKFTGVCYLGPLGCALLLRSGPGRVRWLLMAPLLSLFVYYLCQALGLWLTHAPWGPLSVWNQTLALLRHHVGLTDWQNPATSAWSSWLAPVRYLVLWRMEEGAIVRMVTTRGNPLVWWLSSLTVLSLSLWVLWRGVGPVLSAPPSQQTPRSTVSAFRLGPVSLPARSLVFCLAAYWSLLAPWIVTRRDSYLYHYLPSYLLALVLLSGVFGDVVRSRRRAVFLLMGALVSLSVWYSPRWAGLAPWA
ncbi:MAG: hypothetical protein RL685_627 [Pseudomonadota bacterium]